VYHGTDDAAINEGL